MFDISSGEILILAVVTLVCVKPKDLPVFLRTMGRYAGAVKRQASEMRQQFDTAMREVEYEAMKEEVAKVAKATNDEIMGANKSLQDAAAQTVSSPAASATLLRSNPLAPGATLPEAYTPPKASWDAAHAAVKAADAERAAEIAAKDAAARAALDNTAVHADAATLMPPMPAPPAAAAETSKA